ADVVAQPAECRCAFDFGGDVRRGGEGRAVASRHISRTDAGASIEGEYPSAWTELEIAERRNAVECGNAAQRHLRETRIGRDYQAGGAWRSRILRIGKHRVVVARPW